MDLKEFIKHTLQQTINEQELDEVGRPKIYQSDDILETACKYKNARDFRNNDRGYYNAALRNKMMLKIRTECGYKVLGNLYNRMVYMYIWEKNINAVYFGLTCDEDRRYAEHTEEESKILEKIETAPSCKVGSTSGVNKFIQKHGTFDKYLAISDYMKAELAGLVEMCLIDHYRNDPEWKDKIIVVNRTKGGELGGRCSVNARQVIKDSQNILKNELKTSEEFEKMFPTAYKYWSKNPNRKRVMNQNLNYRLFQDAPYSVDELLDISQLYDQEEKFKEEDKRAYFSARKRKMLDILFPQDKVFFDRNTKKTYKNLKQLSDDLKIDYKDLFNNFERNKNEEKYNISLVSPKEIEQPELFETRLLIKSILEEETSPDEIRKGIDVAVKVLRKRYPFVVGWEYSDSPDTWAYKVYIDLELDYNQSMEYYGLKPHPRYGKFISNSIEDREKLPYPYSLMNYEEETNFDDLEYRKLQDDLTDIYDEMIPSKLKMKQVGAVFNQDDPKDLGVDNYIFVR